MPLSWSCVRLPPLSLLRYDSNLLRTSLSFLSCNSLAIRSPLALIFALSISSIRSCRYSSASSSLNCKTSAGVSVKGPNPYKVEFEIGLDYCATSLDIFADLLLSSYDMSFSSLIKLSSFFLISSTVLCSTLSGVLSSISAIVSLANLSFSCSSFIYCYSSCMILRFTLPLVLLTVLFISFLLIDKSCSSGITLIPYFSCCPWSEVALGLSLSCEPAIEVPFLKTYSSWIPYSELWSLQISFNLSISLSLASMIKL